MEDCKLASIPMQPNLDLKPANPWSIEYPFLQLVGSLVFIARTTRPEIAFAVAKLSQFLTCSCFDKTHWIAAKVIVRYLMGTQ